jgi:glutamine synthetase adenylyltransferase
MGQKLDILSFVEAYFNKVEGFYQWLWERQALVHADEIEATNQLRDRAKAIYEAS